MPVLPHTFSPGGLLEAFESHGLNAVNSRAGIHNILQYGLSNTSPSAEALEKRYLHIGNIYSPLEKRVLQKVGLATASLSVLVSVVTMCWFCRMRKRLRHNLIMFLVAGDLFRAWSMLVLAIIALRQGSINSTSGICQASGWFIQFGTVMNDWAALALAVHGTVQILRPSVNNFHSADIMFTYRHYIYAALIIIPLLCSSLAFIMKSGHYTASGAFCMLPIRPLWYRLALAWIPRYMISITIIGLAIAVYVHARNVYKGDSKRKWWALSSLMVPRMSTVQDSTSALEESFALRSTRSESFSAVQGSRDDTSLVQSQPGGRRFSVLSTAASSVPDRTPKSNLSVDDGDFPTARQGARRRSVASTSVSSASITRIGHSVDMATQENDEITPLPTQLRRPSVRPSITRNSASLSELSTGAGSLREKASSIQSLPNISVRMPSLRRKRAPSTPNALRAQRASIRRHLRLTFIYPLVYILTWVAPFVLHCLQYNNHFAANPPYALGTVATLCLTLMATIDCSIFSYREKPWRHITGNPSGGFWTSFCFWRNAPCSSGRASSGVKGEKRRKSIWRTVNRSSLSSDVDLAPTHTVDNEKAPGGLDPLESVTSSRPRASRQPTLATIASGTSSVAQSATSRSHDDQLSAGGRIVALPAAVARTASLTPRQVSRHSRRALRHLRSGMEPGRSGPARRSDGEQLASELAQSRLQQEREDRRAAGLGAHGWAAVLGRSSGNLHGGARAAEEERHWWDRVRRNDGVDWSSGASRRGTADTVPTVIDVDSEPASPGESPYREIGLTSMLRDFAPALELKRHSGYEEKTREQINESGPSDRKPSSGSESKDGSVAGSGTPLVARGDE